MRRGLLNPALADVVEDIVKKAVYERLVFNYSIVVDVFLANLNFFCEAVEDVGDFLFVDGFDILSHQAESISICNGFVVVVCIDIVTKYTPGFTFQ